MTIEAVRTECGPCFEDSLMQAFALTPPRVSEIAASMRALRCVFVGIQSCWVASGYPVVHSFLKEYFPYPIDVELARSLRSGVERLTICKVNGDHYWSLIVE